MTSTEVYTTAKDHRSHQLNHHCLRCAPEPTRTTLPFLSQLPTAFVITTVACRHNDHNHMSLAP
ncbi:hypothetical protein HanRHA438_Chr14g0632421 [Helianthus annuus]|nr:hypothetical protein HanRHA438_Chr14g0632421 [Helianthus annuus]